MLYIEVEVTRAASQQETGFMKGFFTRCRNDMSVFFKKNTVHGHKIYICIHIIELKNICIYNLIYFQKLSTPVNSIRRR